MIDPTLPMELDDGTPVTLSYEGKNSIVVNVPKSPVRPGHVDSWVRPDSYSYIKETGIFQGGSAKQMFVLQNVSVSSEIHEVLM